VPTWCTSDRPREIRLSTRLFRDINDQEGKPGRPVGAVPGDWVRLGGRGSVIGFVLAMRKRYRLGSSWVEASGIGFVLELARSSRPGGSRIPQTSFFRWFASNGFVFLADPDGPQVGAWDGSGLDRAAGRQAVSRFDPGGAATIPARNRVARAFPLPAPPEGRAERPVSGGPMRGWPR
jgi:hypothetical protein